MLTFLPKPMIRMERNREVMGCGSIGCNALRFAFLCFFPTFFE
jgi:hypothetical protein